MESGKARLGRRGCVTAVLQAVQLPVALCKAGTRPRDTELRGTEGRSRPLPVVMQFAQQWEPQ